MIRLPLRNHRIRWIMEGFILLFVLACSFTSAAPSTQVVEVTRIIPVTQIISATKLVPVTRVVRVTRVVEAPPNTPPATDVPVPSIPTVAVPSQSQVRQGLLVWYDFEDNFMSSGIVTDRSDNGYDAQINGSVNATKGVSNSQAISFDGSGYILAQGNPAAGRNTASFSLWFKTDHPENNYKLASAAWWNGGPGSGWTIATHFSEFWSEDTQSLFFPTLVNNENNFQAGEWVHEVITYDGERIREYTNGQLVNDWETTGATIGSGQAMAVGAWPPLGFGFQGSIDEFKIFAQSLTQAEVKALYNQERN